MTGSTVVIAPDSFKGSLTATGVARAIAEGWRSERPEDVVHLVPLADGGEGTLDAVEHSVPGAVRRTAGAVRGPDGRPVEGEFLLLPDRMAVVELAQCSGLPLMATLDPLGATTYGLGEVIGAALDAGAERLVVGLGGSASTDGGAGALAALGLRSAAGSLDHGGEGLTAVSGIDTSALRARPPGGVVLLTDVRAPLLGSAGAAAVFGPQKGASPSDVALLEQALTRFAHEAGGDPCSPGSGAAGGTAWGLASLWGGSIEPGAAYLATLGRVPGLVADADVVLTGEGRFDSTSLQGKLVGHVISLTPRTAAIGVIAGVVSEPPTRSGGGRAWSLALVDLAPSRASSLQNPARWLFVAGARAARELGSTSGSAASR